MSDQQSKVPNLLKFNHKKYKTLAALLIIQLQLPFSCQYQTPISIKRQSRRSMHSSSALNYKKLNQDIIEYDNNDNNDEIDEIEQKNKDQFKIHLAKMDKVNKIAKSIKGNNINPDLVDAKTTRRSRSCYTDSFGQSLNVPCMPKKLPDGKLVYDKSKKSAYREIANLDDNVISNIESKVTFKETNDSRELKKDGQIIRKEKDGSKTIIDKDGSRSVLNKKDEENELSFKEAMNEMDELSEDPDQIEELDGDEKEDENTMTDETLESESQEEVDAREVDEIQNENPPSPVFKAYDSAAVKKSQSDIEIRPIHSKKEDKLPDHEQTDKINVRDQEQELVENDMPDDYDGENRYDYFNKIRMNQIKEIARIKERQRLARNETVVRQADSFNQSLSNKYSFIPLADRTEPETQHKEQTDVVYSTDAHQNINIDEIYDTVIDEQIFQSETGVIKRKFYKRVIKSSPTKKIHRPIVAPSQSYISEDISPGKRSCTVESQSVPRQSPKATGSPKKVSNLVKQLNSHDSPNKVCSPISKTRRDAISGRRSASVSPLPRRRSTSMENSRKRSSDHLSDKLNVDANKSNDKVVDADAMDDDSLIEESAQINELMNEVEDELNQKSVEYQKFIKDRTRKLQELERIKAQQKAKLIIQNQNDGRDTPEKAYTPTSHKNYQDSNDNGVSDAQKFNANQQNSDPMSRHDFLHSSIKRNQPTMSAQNDKINQVNDKYKNKLNNMIDREAKREVWNNKYGINKNL